MPVVFTMFLNKDDDDDVLRGSLSPGVLAPLALKHQ